MDTMRFQGGKLPLYFTALHTWFWLVAITEGNLIFYWKDWLVLWQIQRKFFFLLETVYFHPTRFPFWCKFYRCLGRTASTTLWWFLPIPWPRAVGAADQSSVEGWALQSSVGNCWMGMEGTCTPLRTSLPPQAGQPWTLELEWFSLPETPPWSQPSQLLPALPFQSPQDLCRSRGPAWPPGVLGRWCHACAGFPGRAATTSDPLSALQLHENISEFLKILSCKLFLVTFFEM